MKVIIPFQMIVRLHECFHYTTFNYTGTVCYVVEESNVKASMKCKEYGKDGAQETIQKTEYKVKGRYLHN